MQAIIVQTFISAPRDAVWTALDARTDVLFDGLPAEAWPAGEEQPPFHRSAPWPFTAESAGAATQLSVTLHQMGGGTRLDVRHEGWGEGPAWDAAIQGHFAGWLQGLAALGLLIETGADARAQDPALAGRERYFISGEIPVAAAAMFRSLTDPAVLARWGGSPLGDAEVVQAIDDRLVRWRMPPAAGFLAVAASSGAAEASPRAEVVAILRPTPRGTHLAIAEYGVTDRAASARWPGMFEALGRFLA